MENSNNEARLENELLTEQRELVRYEASIRRMLERPQPMLVNDMVAELRERGWQVRKGEIEESLKLMCAYRASRKHASGIAVYAWGRPFDSVVDGRGKTRRVFPY